MERIEFSLAEARKLTKSRPGTNEESSFDHSAGDGWDEGLGMSGSHEALIKGVKRERLVSLAAKLRRNIRFREANEPTQVLARSGRMIDRQRYRQGAPKCFWDRKTRRRSTPIVHIGFSIAAPWHISSDVWIQRGAALLTLLNEARKEGLSVALDACMPVWGLFEHSNDSNFFITTRIKAAGSSLSQGVLNFWAAHSAAFRRVGFRLMEEVAKQKHARVDNGYGRAEMEYVDEVMDPYDLWIPQWDTTKAPENVISTAESWTQTITNGKRKESEGSNNQHPA